MKDYEPQKSPGFPFVEEKREARGFLLFSSFCFSVPKQYGMYIQAL